MRRSAFGRSCLCRPVNHPIKLTSISPLCCMRRVPADQFRDVGLCVCPVDFDDRVEEMSLVPRSLRLPVIPPYRHREGKVSGLVVNGLAHS